MDESLVDLVIICMYWLLDFMLLFMLISTITLIIRGEFRQALKYFVSTLVGTVLTVTFLTIFFIGGSPQKVLYMYFQHTSAILKSLVEKIPVAEGIKKEIEKLIGEGLPEAEKETKVAETEVEIKLVKEQIEKDRILYKRVEGVNVYAYSHSLKQQFPLTDVLKSPKDLYFMVDGMDSPQRYVICAVFSDKTTKEFPFVGVTHLSGEYTAENHSVLVNSLIALVSVQFEEEELWVSAQELENTITNASSYTQISSDVLKAFFLKKNWVAIAQSVPRQLGPIKISNYEVGSVYPRTITMDVQKTVFNSVGMDSQKRHFLNRLNNNINKYGHGLDLVLSAVSIPTVALNNYNKAWGYATLRDCYTYSILQTVRDAAEGQKDAQIVEACDDAMAILDDIYGNWIEAMKYSIEQDLPGFLGDAQTAITSAITLITEAYVRAGRITQQLASKINLVLTVVSIELDLLFGAWDVTSRIPISDCLMDLSNVIVHYANIYNEKYSNGEIKLNDLCMMQSLAAISFKASYLSIHILIDRMFVRGIFDCLDVYRDFNGMYLFLFGGQMKEDFASADKLRSFYKENAIKFCSMERLDPVLFAYAYNHTWNIDNLAFHLYQPTQP
ncbi:MAG: hypothetical protein AB1746_09450 [Candidatus Zixiibacteriota bacterium]